MSGPDSLDALRKSFLSPYLPAELAGPRELREADFAELNQHWTLSSRKGASRPLTLLGPWSGVKLQSQPDARFLRHSGDLLIERRVGRGRIVVSAFHLAGRELTSWPGWDNVVNACLLRRLPRHYYRERKEDRLEVDWAGSYDTAPASAHQPGHKLDPRFITHLLYTARDAGVAWDRLAPDLGADPAVIDDRQLAATLANDESRPHPGGGQTGGPGVAAWNDFSPVAQTARQLLAEAARVQVPPRSFVVGIVAIYLMVLVPVNWGIFRLLRRVEWAWAAAPIIAVACTAVVIRMAELDIGFVRSLTEIALVEVQPGYSRAHVSRYTALYASLASNYRVRFPADPGAVAQPFPTQSDPHKSPLLPGQRRLRVDYRFDDGATLSGVAISASVTGMVHSEQMVDLGGNLIVHDRGADCEVENHTRYALSDAVIVRRGPGNERAIEWLGTLASGGRRTSHAPKSAARPLSGRLWNVVGAGELDLSRLANLVSKDVDLAADEIRLVARVEGAIPGQHIDPTPAQVHRGTVLIAHLAYGPGPEPQSDMNTQADAERPHEDGP